MDQSSAHIIESARLEGFMWLKVWRCMNCGHAVDSVIEANHSLHGATVLVPSPEELEKENEIRTGCRIIIGR